MKFKKNSAMKCKQANWKSTFSVIIFNTKYPIIIAKAKLIILRMALNILKQGILLEISSVWFVICLIWLHAEQLLC